MSGIGGALTTFPIRRARVVVRADAREQLFMARGVSASSPLVDANEAAKLLGVPASWLLAQARSRRIPHHRLGHYVRFDIDELIAWLDERKVTTR